ncbi:pyridoxamine-5'-phosphate oxidase-related FMN-binding protein [Geotalea daltonii FRC-32]|uniref:Pyridoxamine-5'-phosphate oxidase-related FMN-binding protein n=1 Tax=Geotalea daltonii (strain DSM 22248 / JCM 15807 / FRC-32) TaxID=316067 RepID=B9M8B6_GEODF|nr:pyridoxamine 5'-phosphate oxidase family protein [Geotalea daltonii]ACM20382.1 pyridoxamine-5'-phosphate oxidase-related FMN-binding protein [Geotalea daltonii FRC-32]
MSMLGIDRVKELFHATSSSVSLGTSSKGELNIAPVGSAFMPDESSIILLRGPLRQTYLNLQENPEAVFLVANKHPFRWLKFFVTGKFGASFGYRIHTRLREVRPVTSAETEAILKKRFGLVAGSRGGRKIQATLKHMMIFDITQIREVTPF